MRRVPAVCAVVLAFAGSGVADEVFLVGGGRVSGVVVERNEKTIVLDVGAGLVALPLSRVERVVTSPSALASFRERAQNLPSDDVAGWLALAYWAQDRSLGTPAREAFEHVLRLDPQNDAAQAALGNVRQDGRWMSPEESYQARGLVLFEGNWVTPSDRDGVRRERRELAAERRAQAERAEAEVRVREAEARAQAAEAAARRAEAERAALERETYVSYSPFIPFEASQCCRPPNACPPSAPAPSAPVVPPTRRTTQDQGAIKQPKPNR